MQKYTSHSFFSLKSDVLGTYPERKWECACETLIGKIKRLRFYFLPLFILLTYWAACLEVIDFRALSFPVTSPPFRSEIDRQSICAVWPVDVGKPLDPVKRCLLPWVALLIYISKMEAKYQKYLPSLPLPSSLPLFLPSFLWVWTLVKYPTTDLLLHPLHISANQLLLPCSLLPVFPSSIFPLLYPSLSSLPPPFFLGVSSARGDLPVDPLRSVSVSVPSLPGESRDQSSGMQDRWHQDTVAAELPKRPQWQDHGVKWRSFLLPLPLFFPKNMDWQDHTSRPSFRIPIGTLVHFSEERDWKISLICYDFLLSLEGTSLMGSVGFSHRTANSLIIFFESYYFLLRTFLYM